MESLHVKKFLATTMFVAGLAVITIGSASATIMTPTYTTSISFAKPTGTLGTSHAYGPITAYGFTATLTGEASGNLVAKHLFGKNGRGDENGLGLSSTNDNEINAPAGSQAIVLDVKNLLGQDLKIGFGSVQDGEGWRVGFSDSMTLPTNESAFTAYLLGNTEKLVDLGVRNSRYLIVEATNKDVLLTSLSHTEVPEPASMALVGAGLIGLGCFRRRASRA